MAEPMTFILQAAKRYCAVINGVRYVGDLKDNRKSTTIYGETYYNLSFLDRQMPIAVRILENAPDGVERTNAPPSMLSLESDALPMVPPVPSIRSPQTLQEWRYHKDQPKGAFPRDMWTSLEPFFLSQGYILWKPQSYALCLSPPNGAPRSPDGFAYSTQYNDLKPKTLSFDMLNTIHCPARTIDNHDVLIRLMAICRDRGERHRVALSRLATGNDALRGDNHVVPVLKEIVHDDMTFAVFPLLSTGFSEPWYYRFSEVLDAVEQILEGINFCHERLVAHLDIDDDNILINWVGGRSQSFDDGRKLTPFRSYFPVRYLLNDFELAVTFDPDSEPSSRLVTGLPTTGIRTGKYGREAAPEMLSGAPYCPFRADIWQLGTMFKSYFGHLGHLSQSLVELFDMMCSEDPKSRPSASAALERVRQLEPSRQTLLSEVPEVPDSEARIARLAAQLDAQIAMRAALP
ncbi:hypothetical protein EW146_g1547 [Bondarzewia mesenterica]|uniref:Protein kinase domain-containing protein n=1 Tax=Bondarzewia mesenterica TaxID=1095465 RepID=A0A4S4M4Y2_9AGAM|nr:hypothetical protein EW146_g1547 [Bondarzewia mesenterica]